MPDFSEIGGQPSSHRDAATTTASLVEPLRPAGHMLEGWSERHPWPMTAALIWARWGPRGRGVVPRRIGKSFGKRWRTVVSTGEGVLLAVDPSALDAYAHIAVSGGWEPWLVRVLRHIVRPSDVVHDIGAHLGYIATAVARTQPSAEVVAFEPQVKLAWHAAISAALNGMSNVEVLPLMLGDSDGDAALYLSSYSAQASLVALEADAKPVQLPMATLDRLVTAGVVSPPDVVKIDVEGAELGVFRGGRETLRAARPYVLLEAIEINLSRFGLNRADVFRELLSFGDYEMFAVERTGFVTAVPEDFERLSVHEFLAVPRERGLPPGLLAA